jgi:hypothetical protein
MRTVRSRNVSVGARFRCWGTRFLKCSSEKTNFPTPHAGAPARHGVRLGAQFRDSLRFGPTARGGCRRMSDSEAAAAAPASMLNRSAGARYDVRKPLASRQAGAPQRTVAKCQKRMWFGRPLTSPCIPETIRRFLGERLACCYALPVEPPNGATGPRARRRGTRARATASQRSIPVLERENI